ncbi:hypothetical protein K438DRAFT_1762420 [Mycena galopus ATCC 62051]|nr:hypothetical protein K438DRAFT_1762420 [Mycena galopus ATCC 62051]
MVRTDQDQKSGVMCSQSGVRLPASDLSPFLRNNQQILRVPLKSAKVVCVRGFAWQKTTNANLDYSKQIQQSIQPSLSSTKIQTRFRSTHPVPKLPSRITARLQPESRSHFFLYWCVALVAIPLFFLRCFDGRPRISPSPRPISRAVENLSNLNHTGFKLNTKN